MPAPRKDSAKFKQIFLETYESLGCRFVTTCRALKIAPNTVRNWRRQRTIKDGVEIENLFDKAMTELETIQAEKVEGNLVNSALDEKRPNTVAQIFYLKHNMKEKYGENITLEVDAKPLWFEQPKELKGE